MQVKLVEQIIYRGKVLRANTSVEVDDETAASLVERKIATKLKEVNEQKEEADETLALTEAELLEKEKAEAKAEYQKFTLPELKDMGKEMEVDFTGLTLKQEFINRLIEKEFE